MDFDTVLLIVVVFVALCVVAWAWSGRR